VESLDRIFRILSGGYGVIGAMIVALFSIGYLLLPRRLLPMSLCRNPIGPGAFGLFLSALLILPFGLKEYRQFTFPKKGDFQVRRLTLTLAPPSGATSSPMTMDLWFPTTGSPSQSERNADSAAGHSCADIAAQSLGGDGGSKRRLVLYMPHFRGSRDDNTRRLMQLASQGYVVAAFDDINLDPPLYRPRPLEEEARLHTWPYASQAQFDHTVMLNNIRVRLAAQKALTGLDMLAHCAAAMGQSAWRDSVDYTHVGFIGYSLGGAAAAEAAVMDPRIIAVVSLDGSLFGRAFTEPFNAAYFYVMRDWWGSGSQFVMPTRRLLNSDDLDERYFWRFEGRHVRREAELAARPGSAGIVVENTKHINFGDAVFEPHLSKAWLLRDPGRQFADVNRLVIAFLDARLRGRRETLADNPISTVEGVRTFRELGMVPGGGFRFPQDQFGAPM